MKPIIILKGTHKNEKSAFDLATRVAKELKERDFKVSQYYTPYAKTMWPLFEQLSKGFGGEQAIKELWNKQHDVSLAKRMLQRSALNHFQVYSFHNSNLENLPEQARRVMFRDLMASKGYESDICSLISLMPMTDISSYRWLGEMPKVIEIGAIYKTEPSFDIKEKFPQEPYLYDVDLEKTQAAGFMSDKVVTEITEGIIEDVKREESRVMEYILEKCLVGFCREKDIKVNEVLEDIMMDRMVESVVGIKHDKKGVHEGLSSALKHYDRKTKKIMLSKDYISRVAEMVLEYDLNIENPGRHDTFQDIYKLK